MVIISHGTNFSLAPKQLQTCPPCQPARDELHGSVIRAVITAQRYIVAPIHLADYRGYARSEHGKASSGASIANANSSHNNRALAEVSTSEISGSTAKMSCK